ncbi:kinase-like domain-containing protein [Aspergillus germanicus]
MVRAQVDFHHARVTLPQQPPTTQLFNGTIPEIHRQATLGSPTVTILEHYTTPAPSSISLLLTGSLPQSPTTADPPTPSYKYNWIDGAEDLWRYCPGGYGYHPIMIGDVLHSIYRIVDKLGFGSYSTVWLTWDKIDRRYLALKAGAAGVVLHVAEILRKLSASQTSLLGHPGRSSIPIAFDDFHIHGPNVTHQRYTREPARCDLREISYSRLFPLDVARALCGGLTQAIAYMHSQGFVHGDIHLPNVLPKLQSSFDHLSQALPPNVPTRVVVPIFLGKYAGDLELSDAQVILSDIGEAFAPDLRTRLGKDRHTPPAMRPPEATFEPDKPLSYSADVWSLAVAIWEILGMKAIFSMKYVPHDEIIAQWIEVLGAEWFDDEGRPTRDRWVWPSIEQASEDGMQKYRRKHDIGESSSEETIAIFHLMRRMLAFRPEDRPSVEEVLKSEWMVKWVMPDYHQSHQLEQ